MFVRILAHGSSLDFITGESATVPRRKGKSAKWRHSQCFHRAASKLSVPRHYGRLRTAPSTQLRLAWPTSSRPSRQDRFPRCRFTTVVVGSNKKLNSIFISTDWLFIWSFNETIEFVWILTWNFYHVVSVRLIYRRINVVILRYVRTAALGHGCIHPSTGIAQHGAAYGSESRARTPRQAQGRYPSS